MVLQIRLVGPHDEVERGREHISKMPGKRIWPRDRINRS